MSLNPGEFLLGLWRAAVAAAQPAACLAGHWPPAPKGRVAVIACGKAAAGMATEAARHFGECAFGIVIVPHEQGGLPVPDGFRMLPARHPVPDDASLAAAEAALQLAAGLGPPDLLLVLLSGGGSALMCLPAAGVTLGAKQALTRQLLASGAPINGINCVRKHLSGIKGGRLAAASAAPVATLIISDVPGDDPALVASGPTVPDPGTLAEARAVIAAYGLYPGAGVEAALRDPANETPSTLPPSVGEPVVVAGAATWLAAAARFCRANAVEPVLLGDDLQGEASALAEAHAKRTRRHARADHPVCLLSGGETTVRTAAGAGRGGRNSEYALALALALRGEPSTWALAADTDGIDGYGGHAGALLDPETLRRGARLGLDASRHLARHDSAGYFAQAGGLLTTGPTGTNVNDLRAILVAPRR